MLKLGHSIGFRWRGLLIKLTTHAPEPQADPGGAEAGADLADRALVEHRIGGRFVAAAQPLVGGVATLPSYLHPAGTSTVTATYQPDVPSWAASSRSRAFSNQMDSTGDSENAVEQDSRAVRPMQSERISL